MYTKQWKPVLYTVLQCTVYTKQWKPVMYAVLQRTVYTVQWKPYIYGIERRQLRNILCIWCYFTSLDIKNSYKVKWRCVKLHNCCVSCSYCTIEKQLLENNSRLLTPQSHCTSNGYSLYQDAEFVLDGLSPCTMYRLEVR